MRHYILGNGPSVTYEFLRDWHPPGKTWAVNRIWKHWTGQHARADLLWRPDFYVRCEVPEYSRDHVAEDLSMMADSKHRNSVYPDIMCYLQQGFERFVETSHIKNYKTFTTCDGKTPHDWHLDRGPLDLLPSICGYGTVVNVAAQLAVMEGATEIVFVGCDLGDEHFYAGEKFANEKLAVKAHEIAARCCPVPVYDGGIGNLPMYRRLDSG